MQPADKVEASRLELFLGVWSGPGLTYPSPWSEGGESRSIWRFRLGPGRRSVIGDFEDERADGGKFEGHGVLTTEPESGEMLWYWFDQIGFPPMAPARGRWDGDSLALVKITPRGRGVATFGFDGEALIYANHAEPTGETTPIQVSQARLERAAD